MIYVNGYAIYHQHTNSTAKAIFSISATPLKKGDVVKIALNGWETPGWNAAGMQLYFAPTY